VPAFSPPSLTTSVVHPSETSNVVRPSETRPRPRTGMYHGTWWDQNKEDSLGELTGGRFTTLLPELPAAQFDTADLRLLAEEMTARQERKPASGIRPNPEEDRAITAAYTYLGQFVDHDLTFDPTSRLREFLDRDQIGKLADFRTPRFDLDNLYGRGPDDQPYMYHRDGIRMLLGEPLSGNPDDPQAAEVPRGPSGRALIGDPRNDENRIVSQLHTIFLRFHNRVADHFGGEASFELVRDQVRYHYQWMLVTDFLPTILDGETFRRVFGDPYNPVPGLRKLRTGLKLMPVEFSVAAYRFGHSMIRREYRLNTAIERPIFSRSPGDTADLGGFRPIPSGWAIDWSFFIDLEPGAIPAGTAPPAGPAIRGPQHAYKIDTSLASPLRSLPAQIASHPSMLALRNLERGNIFRLPSGQHVARALGVDPIPDEKLLIGKASAEARQKPLAEISPRFADKAPLWTYILAEAQAVSWDKAGPGIPKDDIPIKLGPVGSRLIADVFAALLIGDATSFLYQDDPFSPIQEFTRDGRFGLAELVNVALGRAG
jgi:Animal haem peroxidase